MSEKEQVTVENLIDFGIIQGFQGGITTFMESMEEMLQRDVILTEAGGAEVLLQQMLVETETQTETQEVLENFSSLAEKMSRVLKN